MVHGEALVNDLPDLAFKFSGRQDEEPAIIPEPSRELIPY